MSTVGFYKKKYKEDIHPTSPDDVVSSWELKAASLEDSGEVIEIDGEYILSVGVHVSHTPLLMSTKQRLQYGSAFEICNVLTYLTDSPIHLRYGDKTDVEPLFKGIKPYLSLMGFDYLANKYSLQDKIAERYELISETADDDFQRLMPFSTFATSFVTAFDIPKDSSLRRAFYAYRQGVFSVDPQGAILNYWRALEPITNKQQRYEIFDTFESVRLRPVYSRRLPIRRKSTKKFNLLIRYRDYLYRYVSDLQRHYGSRSRILDHLYANRRCPSAHARNDILQIGDDVTLVTLFNDALLLKYIARCAIESYWGRID